MAQAKILVNGVIGSNDNVPINNLVQLNNQNLGGELTYTWAILDQPPSTADALSSSSIQNPTFTPKKEGTYLLKLTVNLGLADEQSDMVIIGIRQMKTLERIPAAGETTQNDLTDGWATTMNSLLRRIDALLSDPGIIIGVAGQSGLTRGNVLKAQGGAPIKAGLPGVETVPSFTLTTAGTLGEVDELLCVLESGVDGSNSPVNGALIKVRYIGRITTLPLGAGALGDEVFLDDAGAISATPGTIRRQVGSIMGVSGSNRDIWFDGVGGADITPIGSNYVIHGSPGTLTNPVRIDGSNASGLSVPATFKAATAGVVPLVAKGASAQTASLFEAQNSGGSALAKIDADGNLVFASTGLSVRWTGGGLLNVGANTLDFTGLDGKTAFGINGPFNTIGFASNAGGYMELNCGVTSAAITITSSYEDSSVTLSAVYDVTTPYIQISGGVDIDELRFYLGGAVTWKIDAAAGHLHATAAGQLIKWPDWHIGEASSKFNIKHAAAAFLELGPTLVEFFNQGGGYPKITGIGNGTVSEATLDVIPLPQLMRSITPVYAEDFSSMGGWSAVAAKGFASPSVLNPTQGAWTHTSAIGLIYPGLTKSCVGDGGNNTSFSLTKILTAPSRISFNLYCDSTDNTEFLDFSIRVGGVTTKYLRCSGTTSATQGGLFVSDVLPPGFYVFEWMSVGGGTYKLVTDVSITPEAMLQDTSKYASIEWRGIDVDSALWTVAANTTYDKWYGQYAQVVSDGTVPSALITWNSEIVNLVTTPVDMPALFWEVAFSAPTTADQRRMILASATPGSPYAFIGFSIVTGSAFITMAHNGGSVRNVPLIWTPDTGKHTMRLSISTAGILVLIDGKAVQTGTGQNASLWAGTDILTESLRPQITADYVSAYPAIKLYSWRFCQRLASNLISGYAGL